MTTVHYGGTEYSSPGGAGLAEAIQRYADEHAGDATALGDGAVTWSATLDFAPQPIVKAGTLTMPDGTVYQGIAAIDVVDGSVTFTPAPKHVYYINGPEFNKPVDRDAEQPPPLV
jgi:hypothetical protein